MRFRLVSIKNIIPMKKLILVSLMVLTVPSITFAVWWNPLTWKGGANQSDEVSSLKAQIVTLQQTITSLSATATSTTTTSQPTENGTKTITVIKYLPCPTASKPAPSPTTTVVPVPVQPATQKPVPTPPTQSSPNYMTYEPISLHDYKQNPTGYLNKPIVFTGNVTDLIPPGSSGYDAGYVKVATGTDVVMLKLSSDDYKKMQSLNVGNYIIVYGSGTASQQFQDFTSAGVPYNSYFAVLNTDRISRCKSTFICNKYDTDDYYVFSK